MQLPESGLSQLASKRAKIVLTSSGAATAEIRDYLAQNVGGLGTGNKLRILRASDGWHQFQHRDNVPLGGRATQFAESAIASRVWSRAYLRYVFGKNVAIKTIELGRLDDDAFTAQVLGADVLLVPGGNTGLTARGLNRHLPSVRGLVNDGELAYIGESAGSIVAGRNLGPALIPPADRQTVDFASLEALGIVDADVVVHAPGRHGRLSVPGIVGRIGDLSLRSVESSADAVDSFVSERPGGVLVINDQQAIGFFDGTARQIG